MNNTIRNFRNEVVGFMCHACGEIKSQMWGTTCNSCRKQSDEAAKLREEIKTLTAAVNNLKINLPPTK